MEAIYRKIEEAGGVACAATRAKYEAALASLSNEWRSIRTLPIDISYYDTLEMNGVIQRAVVQLRRPGGAPCGSDILFRKAA